MTQFIKVILWNEETTLVAGEFKRAKTTTTAKTAKS